MTDLGKCVKCECPNSGAVTQRIAKGNRLAWSVSNNCIHCGHVEEIDGFGIPPVELRAALLKSEGFYQLTVKQKLESDDLLQLKKSLRLTQASLRLLQSKAPGMITRGTKLEMEWLANFMQQRGIPISYGPIEEQGSHYDIPDLSDLVGNAGGSLNDPNLRA